MSVTAAQSSRELTVAGWLRRSRFSLDFSSLRKIPRGFSVPKMVFHPEARLRQEISRKNTISFDIFDTLVTRITLTPDAALRFASLKIEKLTGSKSSFFDLRKSAEDQARRRHATLGDVNLDEIYDEIRHITQWEASIVEACKTIEIETDLATIRPRARMIEILKEAKAANKRVIIVSDTYYPRKIIDRILSDAGALDHIDEIYISSERRARKDTGSMWAMLKRMEKTSELLHIGDNLHSDVEKPSDLSIQGFHIASGYNLLFSSKMKKQLSKWRIRPDDLVSAILLGPLAEKLFNDPFTDVESPFALDRLKSAGFFTYGPILMSFLSAILRDENLMRKKKFLFLAREGYFLIDLYNAMVERAGIDAPEGVYFCCSRLVGLAASVESGVDADLVLGKPGWFAGTMDQLMRFRFGFTEVASSNLKNVVIQIPSNRLHRVIGFVPFTRQFARFVGRPFPLNRRETANYLQSLSKEISIKARQPKQELLAYASDQGVNSRNTSEFAIIDIGYSATIQSSLQRVLAASFDGFYMATSPQARQVEAQGGTARGAFNEALSTSTFMERYSLFIEAFLTAPHGQTIGYTTAGSRTEPVFRETATPNDTMNTLEEMFEGVIAYCRQLTEAFGPDIFGLVGGSTIPLCTIDMLKDGSVTVPKAVIDALQVENLFCGDEWQKVVV